MGVLIVATLLSMASPARSNLLNDLYYSCDKDGNSQICGRLGTLCGQGNWRACNLVKTGVNTERENLSKVYQNSS